METWRQTGLCHRSAFIFLPGAEKVQIGGKQSERWWCHYSVAITSCTQHLLYWWYTKAKNTPISSLSNKTFTSQFDRLFEFCHSWRWSGEWKIKHIITMNSCRPTLVWLQFITCHFRSGMDFWGLNPTEYTCVWGSGVFPAVRQQIVFISLLFQHDSLSFETTRSSPGCQKHIL